MDARLFGIIKTKSPLSHISEAISTNSYLAQDPILQDDGTIEEVFCYSGNALRGQMRDCCSRFMLKYMVRKLGLDSFHLMFSGGKIGGDQVVDIQAAKILRQNIPVIGILGGGIGNQIIAGKIKFQCIYPICKEAIPVLPRELYEKAMLRTYVNMTYEKSFTRMDDAKSDLNSDYITEKHEKPNEPGEKKKNVSDQMRMTSELVVAGVELYSVIDLVGVTEIEIGALLSGFYDFVVAPYIGGQSNKGHGYVDLNYAFISNSKLDANFISIRDGKLNLSNEALGYVSKYTAILDRSKTEFITDESIIDKSKIEKVMSNFWGA